LCGARSDRGDGRLRAENERLVAENARLRGQLEAGAERRRFVAHRSQNAASSTPSRGSRRVSIAGGAAEAPFADEVHARSRGDRSGVELDLAIRRVMAWNTLVLLCSSRMDRQTRQRSFRLSVNTLDLLEQRARERRQTGNRLAERLIDEGLRTLDHPLIQFRQGASGERRPALAGSRLYVWQVVDTVRASDGSVAAAAEYLGLSRARVQACVSYYADFRDEVDAYAEEERELARREQDRSRREQEVTG